MHSVTHRITLEHICGESYDQMDMWYVIEKYKFCRRCNKLINLHDLIYIKEKKIIENSCWWKPWTW